MTSTPVKNEITGRKVFFAMVAAFGVIITVNLVLAFSAIRTFPGLEVKNSYVASQEFDVNRNAQLALGWDVGARIDGTTLRLTILDEAGNPVRPVSMEGIFGRPTSVRDDQNPEFIWTGEGFEAEVTAGPGNWNLRLVATAENGTEFRQRIVVLNE